MGKVFLLRVSRGETGGGFLLRVSRGETGGGFLLRVSRGEAGEDTSPVHTQLQANQILYTLCINSVGDISSLVPCDFQCCITLSKDL